MKSLDLGITFHPFIHRLISNYSPKANLKKKRENNMDHIKLTREVLSTGEVADAVTDPSCGAVSLFVGTTRNHFQVVKSLG